MGQGHCWKDYREYLEEIGQIYSEEWVHTYAPDGDKTCLREDGHEGDHEWTSSRDIVISLKQ